MTACTRHQASMSSPRWRLPDLEFRDTLDENFIGLESSLEAEILVSNLPLYNLFVGKEKKLPFGNELISFNTDNV